MILRATSSGMYHDSFLIFFPFASQTWLHILHFLVGFCFLAVSRIITGKYQPLSLLGFVLACGWTLDLGENSSMRLKKSFFIGFIFTTLDWVVPICTGPFCSFLPLYVIIQNYCCRLCNLFISLAHRLHLKTVLSEWMGFIRHTSLLSYLSAVPYPSERWQLHPSLSFYCENLVASPSALVLPAPARLVHQALINDSLWYTKNFELPTEAFQNGPYLIWLWMVFWIIYWTVWKMKTLFTEKHLTTTTCNSMFDKILEFKALNVWYSIFDILGSLQCFATV